jgi:hypothetical protein
MIGKPENDLTDVKNYRPISLLPIMTKLLEKLILRRLNKDLLSREWIPDYQFRFRPAHSTMQQCHRLTREIRKAMENKEHCSVVFLDISHAFDKVWHQGLLYINQNYSTIIVLETITVLPTRTSILH